MEFTATYILTPLCCRLHVIESSDPGKALQTVFIKTITFFCMLHLLFLKKFLNNVRAPTSAMHIAMT